MFKTLKDFRVENKRILVRCDFNVPLDSKGNILDDFRIRQAVKTIKYLQDNNAKIILMSHLDPESTGVADFKFNLNAVAKKLAEILGKEVKKSADCVGQEVENDVSSLKPGEILLLENLRFHKEETDNDKEFAEKLSKLGDIYVNDAFSVCHRDHASISGVPKYMPSCAGLLLEKEITALDKVMNNPEKPMVAVVGGAKVQTKAKFIDKISEVADFVIISGLIKKEALEKKIKFKYPKKIIGPAEHLDALDIDGKTIAMFCEKIMSPYGRSSEGGHAKTILWNGPFGKFEEEKYAGGTFALAEAIIQSHAFSVVGGGETVEFIEKQGMLDKFSHVSTGGGAMLAYLSGEEMPGLKALEK